MSRVADPLRAGRDAIKRRAWQKAYDLLTAADASRELSPEDLESLTKAAWCTGRYQEGIDAYERAYAAYVERGNRSRAAYVALWLAYGYAVRRAGAVATGWQNRAERLLEQEPEGLEHGYLAALAHTDAALDGGDLDRALGCATSAFEIGKRFGDRDLQAFGLFHKGRIMVHKGEIAKGTALLDEAMAAAVGGELGPEVARWIFCVTIRTCQSLADYRRAAEWIEAGERLCEREDLAVMSAECRAHRTQIMRLRGAWAKAEQEARRARDEYRNWNFALGHVGGALYEIGEIRLRQGNFGAAEEAFRQAHELVREPQPGLSLLRLAEGNVEAAAGAIKYALADQSMHPLARAQRLPAQVEIALAAGDVDSARSAIVELEGIAKTYRTPALEATAVCARGALELGEGDASAACRSLQEGLRLWQEVYAPYEAARVRMMLATGRRAEGDDETAVLELRAAHAAFERLGAVPDARRAAHLLGSDTAVAGAQPRATSEIIRTFMFTDIVKSTTLLEAIGDEAWADLLRWHDSTLRSLFAHHGGEEIDHAGDGFFVAFKTATPAIECAIAIQRALVDHRRLHGFSPHVRIGLHAAKATYRDSHYRGKSVHQAARIAALAEAGEILASQEALGTDDARFTVSRPREVTLKGISDPVRVVTIDWH
jgi:class 3 adenylate cyclase